jgi:CheY-like chemotaxis protein
MKILILEDNEERVKQFRRNLTGNDVVVTANAAECIELLDHGEWDWVFLDHDLGDKVFEKSGPGTGYEVAKWMGQHPNKWPNQGVVIHSCNFVGAQNMESVLPAPAWKIPFVWQSADIQTFLTEESDGCNVRGRSGQDAMRGGGLPAQR